MRIADLLKDGLDCVKVGYPLILASGLDVVRRLSKMTPVIADLKVADIPNTNRLICEQVLAAGAFGIIAHAFTGRDSLEACIEAARRAGAEVYAVTEMSHPGAVEFLAPQAEKMATLAADAGADGVVAPATRPDRIRLIRSIVGDLTIISPGVGAQGGSAREALAAGADHLIVGRSIYESRDPRVALDRILAEIG